jgi:hypothetical protein
MQAGWDSIGTRLPLARLALLTVLLCAAGCLVHQERLSVVRAGPFRITCYGQPDCQSISDPNPIRIKPAWRSTRRVKDYALSPDARMYAFARHDWGEHGSSSIVVGVADRHRVLAEKRVSLGGFFWVRWVSTDAVALDRYGLPPSGPMPSRLSTEIVRLADGEEASP